jgi:hypothetical protein
MSDDKHRKSDIDAAIAAAGKIGSSIHSTAAPIAG